MRSRVLAIFVSAVMMLFVTAKVANASIWQFICNASNGEACYADIESIEKKGDLISVWVRKDDKDIESITNESKKIASSKVLFSIKIAEKSYRILQGILYKKSGEVISSYNEATQWSKFVPDSVGYGIFEFVSEWEKSNRKHLNH